VSMGYRPGHSILKGVSFSVETGMKVALVGATGSGKTSALSLLPRLYPISHGQILIDGVPIEKWQRSALRRQLGMVSQDVVIFRGTLRENLLAAYEGPPVTDDEIMTYCRRSGLSQILHHFGQGLDTEIVEGGDNLSMGERQLVAFTRMMIRNPAILMLDEATANIDEDLEFVIQKAMEEALIGRTCFIIAHRLSTVVKCDLILVFANGQIVEHGNHADLMMRVNGVYRQMAEQQLS